MFPFSLVAHRDVHGRQKHPLFVVLTAGIVVNSPTNTEKQVFNYDLTGDLAVVRKPMPAIGCVCRGLLHMPSLGGKHLLKLVQALVILIHRASD